MRLGFDRFNLSLGTTSAEDGERQDRKIDLDRYRAVLEVIARAGLPSTTYFIAGLGADTTLAVTERLLLLAGLPTLVGISLYYPVPGIEGFDPPPRLLLEHPGLARGSFAYPWTGSLSTAELVTAFRLARFANLAKKKKPLGPERDLLEKIKASKRLLTLRKTAGKIEMTTPPSLDPALEALFFSSFPV